MFACANAHHGEIFTLIKKLEKKILIVQAHVQQLDKIKPARS